MKDRDRRLEDTEAVTVSVTQTQTQTDRQTQTEGKRGRQTGRGREKLTEACVFHTGPLTRHPLTTNLAPLVMLQAYYL